MKSESAFDSFSPLKKKVYKAAHNFRKLWHNEKLAEEVHDLYDRYQNAKNSDEAHELKREILEKFVMSQSVSRARAHRDSDNKNSQPITMSENQVRQLVREVLMESVFSNEQYIIEEGVFSGIKEKLFKVAKKLINKLPKDLLDSISQEVEAAIGKPASELTMADINKSNIEKIKQGGLSEESNKDYFGKKRRISSIVDRISAVAGLSGLGGSIFSMLDKTNYDTKMFFYSMFILIIATLTESVHKVFKKKYKSEEDFGIEVDLKGVFRKIKGKNVADIDFESLSKTSNLNFLPKKEENKILVGDYLDRYIGSIYFRDGGEISDLHITDFDKQLPPGASASFWTWDYDWHNPSSFKR